jgi:hypothetical protein
MGLQMIRFESPATYMARAVRYLIELDGQQIHFEVRPSRLGWLLGTPPVLVELPAGTIVAGRTGRGQTPTSEPEPRHG